MRVLAAWLEEGEKELWEKKSLDPLIFRDDEHGIIYNREPHMRDTMLDHWHPWEKVRCFPLGSFTIYVYNARWVGGQKSGKFVNVYSIKIVNEGRWVVKYM